MLKIIRTWTLLLALVPGLLPAATKSKSRAASAYGKPNVLFIIADDLRDYVGWMGGHPQSVTPNMDRLSKKGMRFTNAHCNYALCNPSRTSLLTGMLPSSSGVFGNEQDWRRSVQIAGKPTLPEHFKAQGYLTVAAGKIFHANHGGPEGRLTGWHGGRRGFEQDAAWDQRFPSVGVQIPDLPIHTGQNFNGLNIWHWDWGGIQVEDEKTDDGQIAAFAAEFLSQKQKKPFFLALGLYRPHSPWYVPQKYFDALPLDSIKLPEVKADDLDDVPAIAKSHLKDGHHQKIVEKNLWKAAVRAYLANVAFCDAMLGRILEAVEKGPNAKNTIIVFTSDHGWYLGEKQMWHKGKLWEPTTRVPLTIYAPGATKPDTASAQPVALIDLYPTLCDLVKLPKPEHLDGASLKPLLLDPTAKREKPAIICMSGGKNAGYAARDERWRYIRYADGGEELYDHQSDPNEWTNLAAKPDLVPEKVRLAAFFPAEFKSAVRPVSEMVKPASPSGSVDLMLSIGDEISAGEAPKLQGRGVFIDAVFDFDPLVDQDSTLLAQGDAQSGYALHLVAAKPTLTVFVDGKAAEVTGAALEKGRVNIRALVDGGGALSIAVPGHSEVIGVAPFEAGFPHEPKSGIAVGQSFGILKAANYPNSTPFDGQVHRLNLTVLSPHIPTPTAKP
ncbi:sulfatase [Prosthecobacter sp.]|jgi:arylsulfatase A-like enzyme|uniref:sulfatase n=1 Tax=Prosthecobacter sp. TaxID=1965333 RepID=UPI00378367F2